MSHFCSSFPWCIPFSGFPTNEWQRIDSSKDLQSCKYLKSVGFRKDYISHHYYCFLFKNCSFYLVWSKYGAQTPATIVFLQTGIKYSGGFAKSRNDATYKSTSFTSNFWIYELHQKEPRHNTNYGKKQTFYYLEKQSVLKTNSSEITTKNQQALRLKSTIICYFTNSIAIFHSKR